MRLFFLIPLGRCIQIQLDGCIRKQLDGCFETQLERCFQIQQVSFYQIQTYMWILKQLQVQQKNWFVTIRKKNIQIQRGTCNHERKNTWSNEQMKEFIIHSWIDKSIKQWAEILICIRTDVFVPNGKDVFIYKRKDVFVSKTTHMW